MASRPKPNRPVRVVLDAAMGGTPLRGQVYYFVMIVGVPGAPALCVGNAQPIEDAERLKKQVEAALAAFPVPDPKEKRRKKSVWRHVLENVRRPKKPRPTKKPTGGAL